MSFNIEWIYSCRFPTLWALQGANKLYKYAVFTVKKIKLSINVASVSSYWNAGMDRRAQRTGGGLAHLAPMSV